MPMVTSYLSSTLEENSALEDKSVVAINSATVVLGGCCAQSLKNS